MRFNALLHSAFGYEAPATRQQPARRWWLGWLQLLCAWVLCMLLCANIALVFAQDLSGRKGEVSAGRPAGCAVTGSAAQPVPVNGIRADVAKGQRLPC
ncbi:MULTISPECIES: hypothetical protein [Variovorax]|jgi:hypothetical protein|uniref:hypothetical protein n=1 Tax=Variovorax TaxID=34072 RepID=UPI00036DAC89|nr:MULTISPECIES: hypothetical protein [Variovorax]MDR6523550.1 hypothetical protein [Variovorax paradoxus]RTD88527.1 hypothetical protein EJO68_22955 [Variovorax sp. 369]